MITTRTGIIINNITVTIRQKRYYVLVDINYLIQNSNIGKKTLTNISNIDKNNLDNLKKKNKILQDLELSIKKKKNVISDEAYNKEVIDFKKKFQEFSKEKNNTVKEFNVFKKKEIVSSDPEKKKDPDKTDDIYPLW